MTPWILYALLSALCAALVAIFGKLGISRVDSTLATAVRATVMALTTVSVALMLGKAKLVSTIDGRAMLFIVLSGLAGAASWFWYFLALKTGPVSGVVALDRLSVVFALVLAILFVGERLSWSSAGGAVLIVAGALLLTR